MVAPPSLRVAALRWLVLLALTALLTAALSAMRIPAALLLAPMLAAILVTAMEAGVRVPNIAFLAAQAVIGCMIARSMRASLLQEIGQRWPMFAFAALSLIVVAVTLGWALTHWRVFPGTTALWGSFPGAAMTMTLMAEAYGADVRLVAFMQYFRVVLVTLVASAVVHVLSVGGGASAPMPTGATTLNLHAFAATLALAAIGGTAGVLLRVPAGALIVPMLAGTVFQGAGLMTIELPQPVLASAYMLVGWSIGLRFTREILVHCLHALPRVAASIMALIIGCALFAVGLVVWGGIDPLTAYLAMSPGGADTVAIIAASSGKIDLSFVMALQMTRFLIILAVGPSLARFIAARTASESS